MKEIEIIVRGRPGSGKTTFSNEIAKHLASLGFNTNVDDPDDKPTPGVQAVRLEWLKKQHENYFIRVLTETPKRK